MLGARINTITGKWELHSLCIHFAFEFRILCLLTPGIQLASPWNRLRFAGTGLLHVLSYGLVVPVCYTYYLVVWWYRSVTRIILWFAGTGLLHVLSYDLLVPVSYTYCLMVCWYRSVTRKLLSYSSNILATRI
jgi:hypothetical protein